MSSGGDGNHLKTHDEGLLISYLSTRLVCVFHKAEEFSSLIEASRSKRGIVARCVQSLSKFRPQALFLL